MEPKANLSGIQCLKPAARHPWPRTLIKTHPPARKRTTPKRGRGVAFQLTREQHPVPTLYGAFRRLVRTEVEQYLILRGMKSDTIGGPSGIVLPPYRVMRLSDKHEWSRKASKDSEYVFCHDDPAQHMLLSILKH